MIDPVDPLMMRERSDDDGDDDEFTLLDLPASLLRTGGGDGDSIIGRAAMACN